MTDPVERLNDMYAEFCQGTHTDPIDRPKASIFLLAAFGIGFALANIPQWWHRLLPPQARCMLGEEGHEEGAPPPTQPRNGRGRATREDASNASFWESSRPVMAAIMGGGSAHSQVAAPVSIEACVSVINALPASENPMEQRVREAALSRLFPLLQMPQQPNRNQRRRVHSPGHDIDSE